MARGDAREEKQRKRALEELDKGLRRGDIDIALAALATLPAAEAGGPTAQVAPLFRSAVDAAKRGKQWAKCLQLAARAERAPALLEAGVEPGVSAGYWWALLWACGRQGDFDRVGRLWARLSPEAEVVAPRLAAAVSSWVAGRGQIEEQAFEALKLPAVEPPDPRLGYEPKRARREHAAPRKPEDVEAAVLSARASEPWPLFPQLIHRWANQLPPATATPMLVLAGKLSLREMLSRLATSAAKGSESLSLLAFAAQQLPSPEPLEAELLRAFRIVLRGLGQPVDGAASAAAGGERAQFAQYLPSLAGSLVRIERHRKVVLDALSGLKVDHLPAADGLALFERLMVIAPGLGMLAKAIDRWQALSDQHQEAASDTRLFAALTALSPAGFTAAGLKALTPKERAGLLGYVGSSAPPAFVERVFDGSWGEADDALRRSLSLMVETMARCAVEDEEDLEDEEGPFGSMPGSLAKMLGFPSSGGRGHPVDNPGLTTARRLSQRAMKFSPGLIELLIDVANSDSDALSLAKSFVSDASTIDVWLTGCRLLGMSDREGPTLKLLELTLERFSSDLAQLSKGMLWCKRTGAPPFVGQAVAAALMDLHATSCPGNHWPELDEALSLAEFFVSFGRRRAKKPRATAAQKAAAEKKKAAAAAKRAEKVAAKKEAERAARGAAAAAKKAATAQKRAEVAAQKRAEAEQRRAAAAKRAAEKAEAKEVAQRMKNALPEGAPRPALSDMLEGLQARAVPPGTSQPTPPEGRQPGPPGGGQAIPSGNTAGARPGKGRGRRSKEQP